VNALKLGRDVVRGGGRNLGYHLGLRLAEPQPVYPPALLRARAMRKLAGSPRVQTQFIARARYRGGATDATRRAQTTQEFYQNIAETDYTLCVRGGGNFSKRFYETLAMGRIPVLIDTDCLLPFEPGLAWDGFVVRVPANDLASLPRRVADHFAAVGTAGLAEQKKKCRQLWNDWLSFGNFHRRLADHILETR
jgi:Exostosin family